MSGMVDGCSKVFILEHSSGAMHLDGYKTYGDLAYSAMRKAVFVPAPGSPATKEGKIATIATLIGRLENIIREIQEEY